MSTRGEASGAGDASHTAVHHLNLFLSLAHGAFLLCGLLVEDLAESGPFPGPDLDSFTDSAMWEDVIPTGNPLPRRVERRWADCDDGHLKQEEPVIDTGNTGGITPFGQGTRWQNIREQHHPTAIPHPMTKVHCDKSLRGGGCSFSKPWCLLRDA